MMSRRSHDDISSAGEQLRRHFDVKFLRSFKIDDQLTTFQRQELQPLYELQPLCGGILAGNATHVRAGQFIGECQAGTVADSAAGFCELAPLVYRRNSSKDIPGSLDYSIHV